MGKFLTEAFARKQPKLPSRNFRFFRSLCLTPFPRSRCVVKLLPIPFKIASPCAALEPSGGHLNEPGLILVQPEPEQNEVGTLKMNRGRTR
jgi:hypothetical protein